MKKYKIKFEDGKTKSSFIVSKKEFDEVYNSVAPKGRKNSHLV
jgi:hypothetical protein